MPRKWMKSCIEQVEEKGMVTNPAAVCAANWYHKMSEADRQKILRQEKSRKAKARKYARKYRKKRGK